MSAPTPTPLTDDEFRSVGAHIERLWRDASQNVAVLHAYCYTRDERSARHERERIAGELEAAATGMGDDLDDYGRGLRNGFRLAARRASKDDGA